MNTLIKTREELTAEIRKTLSHYYLYSESAIWLEDQINKLFDNFFENSSHIKRLEDRSEWLQCLEYAGVDNWEGYNLAHDIKDGII